MTEIEMHIETLEKLIPEIEMCMNLFSYDRSALQAALQALRRTSEDDKAREEGRLVVFPCKVGQTVYEVNLPDEFAEVCEYIVQDVSTKKIMFCDDWYPLSYIGKTVFLTRAEAEAALGGGGDG